MEKPKDLEGKTQGFGRVFSPVIFPLGCSISFFWGGISNNPRAGFAKIRFERVGIPFQRKKDHLNYWMCVSMYVYKSGFP